MNTKTTLPGCRARLSEYSPRLLGVAPAALRFCLAGPKPLRTPIPPRGISLSWGSKRGDRGPFSSARTLLRRRDAWRVHGSTTGSRPSRGPTGDEKSSVGAARLPQIGGFFYRVLSVSNPLIASPLVESIQPKIQLLTVDHSARGSMKTAANCVS